MNLSNCRKQQLMKLQLSVITMSKKILSLIIIQFSCSVNIITRSFNAPHQIFFSFDACMYHLYFWLRLDLSFGILSPWLISKCSDSSRHPKAGHVQKCPCPWSSAQIVCLTALSTCFVWKRIGRCCFAVFFSEEQFSTAKVQALCTCSMIFSLSCRYKRMNDKENIFCRLTAWSMEVLYGPAPCKKLQARANHQVWQPSLKNWWK